MTHHRLRKAFVILHYTLGIVVFTQSVTTAVAATGAGSAAARNPHLMVLAVVEAVAAVLFVVPRTVRLGGWMLLGVFTLAVAAHAMRNEIASTLVVYAAAVGFIMAHGPVVSVRPLVASSAPPN